MTEQDLTALFLTMQSHALTAIHELFDGYGMFVRGAIDVAPPLPAATESVAAYLGFAGSGVRGAVVLVAAPETVRCWQAAVGELEPSACDTIGEFSNMLLGRIKGRFIPEGVPIMLATPITASGKEIAFSGEKNGRPVWFGVEGDGWRFDVRFEVAFDADFQLESRRRSVAVAQAGDMFLF